MIFMIDVLDYGVGNIRSVLNAFNDVSDSVKFCKSVNEVRDSSRIVFPGVGAFQPAMKKLIDGSWISLIRNFREENRPVLGICLGFQLMHKISEENGIHEVFEICLKNNVLVLRSFNEFPSLFYVFLT